MTANNKNLKGVKILFWVTTSIVVLFESVMTIIFFNSPQAIEGMHHYGFPNYFRVELSIAKVIGGIILIIPAMPARLREWAYVGFGISCISAIIANYSVEGPAAAIFPGVFFIILLLSYTSFHKIRKAKGQEL